MIDIRTEQLLPIKNVPAYLESRGLGSRIHASVVYRWISRGSGDVKLEVIRIGGLMVTSVEALQRWVVARNTPKPDADSQPKVQARAYETWPRPRRRLLRDMFSQT